MLIKNDSHTNTYEVRSTFNPLDTERALQGDDGCSATTSALAVDQGGSYSATMAVHTCLSVPRTQSLAHQLMYC